MCDLSRGQLCLARKKQATRLGLYTPMKHDLVDVRPLTWRTLLSSQETTYTPGYSCALKYVSVLDLCPYVPKKASVFTLSRERFMLSLQDTSYTPGHLMPLRYGSVLVLLYDRPIRPVFCHGPPRPEQILLRSSGPDR